MRSRGLTSCLRSRAAVLIAAGLIVPGTALSVSVRYDIQPLGLIDAAHTGLGNHRNTFGVQLNGSGGAIGQSERFDAGGASNGQSAWYFDGRRSRNIGLADGLHTGGSGQHSSHAVELNDAGQAIGTSQRFGGTLSGQSAWFFNGRTTRRIGIEPGGSVDPNTYHEVVDLNQAGQAVGHSARGIGGQVAWLYERGTTREIGLDPTGEGFSLVSRLNEAGQAVGYTQRRDSNGRFGGQWAWIHDGSDSRRIGLIDAEHTSRHDGLQYSAAALVNEAGQVAGSSVRGDINEVEGVSAWLYDGVETRNIGLVDAEHIGDSRQFHGNGSPGYRVSLVYALNNAGQVLGVAERFEPGFGEPDGITTWLYDGTVTRNIGLVDAEHTAGPGRKCQHPSGIPVSVCRGVEFPFGSENYRYSAPVGLNEVGQAIGISERFNADRLNGLSAWFYDGANTRRIGLTGPAYTGDGGFRESAPTRLNDAGQVIGQARRFDALGGDAGESAWFYDSVMDLTYDLTVSERSDGYASSFAHYLGDGGLVLGSYELFDPANDRLLGSRAFGFTIDEGIWELSLVLEDVLTDAGWAILAAAVEANGFEQIAGYGQLADMVSGQVGYLLSPGRNPAPVPVPGAALMFASALGLLVAAGWRRGRAATA